MKEIESIKTVFQPTAMQVGLLAENELAAEEMLQEKREAPVVEEWEK